MYMNFLEFHKEGQKFFCSVPSLRGRVRMQSERADVRVPIGAFIQ